MQFFHVIHKYNAFKIITMVMLSNEMLVICFLLIHILYLQPMYDPRRRNVTTSMVGLKTITYAKISRPYPSLPMVKPIDVTGNAHNEELMYECTIKAVPAYSGKPRRKAQNKVYCFMGNKANRSCKQTAAD